MKKYISKTYIKTSNPLILVIILLFMSSCGFQGRKYTTGHYWNGRNEIEYEKQSESESEKQKEKERKLSIHLEDTSIEFDTLKIPLYRKNSKRYQRNHPEKAENKQESPQSSALKGEHTNGSADTTLVSEIKALNKKFNTSAILFWSNGVFSTITGLILTVPDLGAIFSYTLSILTRLSICIGILALFYNGYISVKLGRKLRKNRDQLPKEKWVRRIKAKVLWVKLLFYLPLLLLIGSVLALVISFLSNGR